MDSTLPSFCLGYWRPWNSDSNFVDSYCDYLKDVTLVNYAADAISAEIQDTANAIGYKLDGITSAQLQTNKELQALNRRMDIVIEQQRMTSLLLADIAKVLRIPDSEKERTQKINWGLKFFVNGAKDSDMYKESLMYFLEAEKICPTDYFVLHKIGCLYLYVPSLINLEQAAKYLSKAAKFAAVESDPGAARLANYLIGSKDSADPSKIGLLAADSFNKAAFAFYVLGDVNMAIQSQMKAVSYNPSAENYYCLAKYYCRNNNIEIAIENLNKAYLLSSQIGNASLLDPDFNVHPEILDALAKIVSISLDSFENLLKEEPDRIVKASLIGVKNFFNNQQLCQIANVRKPTINVPLFFKHGNRENAIVRKINGFDNYFVTYDYHPDDFNDHSDRLCSICDSTGKEIIAGWGEIKLADESKFVAKRTLPYVCGFYDFAYDRIAEFRITGELISLYRRRTEKYTLYDYPNAVSLYDDEKVTKCYPKLFDEVVSFKARRSEKNPEQFIDDFSEHKYYNVQENGKWGVICRESGVIIPCQYSSPLSMMENTDCLDSFTSYLLSNIINDDYEDDNPSYSGTQIQRELKKMEEKIKQEKEALLKKETETSNGCYIATCVYGSYDCPEVWTLRRFRDNVLAGTWYGRAFIRIYYEISPIVVKLFGSTKLFSKTFKAPLNRMVTSLRKKGFESTPYCDKF